MQSDADDPLDSPARPLAHETALVATGSADGRAYLYSLSSGAGGGYAQRRLNEDGSTSGGGVSHELVQVLDGHADRVYATSFHPHEPLLATCSADFVVKVWRGPG